MASSYPQVQQQYRDDNKEGSVGVHAPLLPTASLPVHPRWMHEVKPLDKSRRPRKFRLALGALAVTYLLYCGWVAYSGRHKTYLHYHEAPSEVDVFPHPFPHPPRRPHHPPGPPPEISVLGCVPIPEIDTEDTVSEKIKLSVSYPANATVILHNKFLFGDVSVEKINDEKDDDELMEGTEESTLNVAIKVAARPPFPAPPLPGHPVDQETDEEEKFLLCATTFVPHSPPEHKPPHPEIEGEHPPLPPHPHGRFHGPPVIVDIFPALNETYPKLPPPPFPHHPPRRHHHHKHIKPRLSTVWRATVSFLFPMFTELPNNHGVHHHHPCPGAPHLPPLPPFIVTQISSTIPKTSHVVYGLPPPPPPFFHPFPFPHPHHPRPDAQ